MHDSVQVISYSFPKETISGDANEEVNLASNARNTGSVNNDTSDGITTPTTPKRLYVFFLLMSNIISVTLR